MAEVEDFDFGYSVYCILVTTYVMMHLLLEQHVLCPYPGAFLIPSRITRASGETWQMAT